MGVQQVLFGSAAAAVGASTWNPLDKAAGITLSNANETTVATTVPSAVRGTQSHNTGKWYFEVTINVTGTLDIGVATSLSTLTPSSVINIGDQYGVLRPVTGAVYHPVNLSNGGYAVSAVGDRVGVCLNADLGSMWFANNNVYLGNPGAGTGGVVCVTPGSTVFPYFLGEVAGAGVTLFPTAASQTYAPPTGFTSWG